MHVKWHQIINCIQATKKEKQNSQQVQLSLSEQASDYLVILKETLKLPAHSYYRSFSPVFFLAFLLLTSLEILWRTNDFQESFVMLSRKWNILTNKVKGLICPLWTTTICFQFTKLSGVSWYLSVSFSACWSPLSVLISSLKFPCQDDPVVKPSNYFQFLFSTISKTVDIFSQANYSPSLHTKSLLSHFLFLWPSCEFCCDPFFCGGVPQALFQFSSLLTLYIQSRLPPSFI